MKYICVVSFNVDKYDCDDHYIDIPGEHLPINKNTIWTLSDTNFLDTEVTLIDDNLNWIGIPKRYLDTFFRPVQED